MANLYLPALSPVAKALRGAGSHDFPAQTNVADFEALGRYGIFCYFPLHEGKGEPRDVFNYITDMATFSQNNSVFAWRSEADYGYLPSQGVGPKDISVAADWACGYESASAVVDKFNGRTELSFFATVRLRNGNAAWHNAAASFETIVFRANGVFALDLMGGDENGLDLRYLLATSGTSGWTASNDKQADEWELGTGQGGKEFLLCGTWDGSTLSYYFGTLDNFQKVGTATVTGSIDDAVPTGKLYIGGVNYASTLGVPGLVTGCGISNRCLSEAEVISLFRHREKFLKPANQSPYLFSIPAAGGGDVAFSGVGQAGTSSGAGQTGQLAFGRSLTGDAGTGAGAGQAGVGTFGTSIPFIGEGAAGTAAGAGQSGQLITGIALEGDAGAATGAGQVGQGQFGGAFSGQGSAGVGSGVGQSGILALGHVLNGGTGTASGAGQPGAAIIGASFIGEGQSGTGTGAGQAGQLTAGVDGSFRGEGAAGVGTGEGSIGQLVLGFILEGNTGTGTGAGYAGSILTDDGVVSEWMTASLRMINAAYRLGDPARYLPTAGGTLDVTVVHTQDQIDVLSEAGVGVRAADHLVFVRKNEVAAPAVGDRVIEYGKIFTVERVEQFNEHEWVMNVRV